MKLLLSLIFLLASIGIVHSNSISGHVIKELVGSNFVFMAKDHKGHAVFTKNLNDLVFFDSDGNEIKKMMIKGKTSQEIRNIIFNSDGSMVLLDDSSIHFLDHEAKVKSTHAITAMIQWYNGQPKHLVKMKNGDFLVIDELALYRFSDNGRFKGKFLMGSLSTPVELSGGTIAIPGSSHVYFLSPELKLLSKFPIEKGAHLHLMGPNLVFVSDFGGSAYFIDADGKLKSENKYVTKGMPSFCVNLPKELAACVGDSMVFFHDQIGTLVASHLHDSNQASNPVLLNESWVVYANKTELVFLNFEGQEIGTFPLVSYRSHLISMAEGKLIALGWANKISFISFKKKVPVP